MPNESKQGPDPVILFEDAHLMVLSKPAGLLSQGDDGKDPNLVDWLRHYLGRVYVGLIHRLDRNTSGIMLVAKRTKAARRLTAALQAGDVKRVYLAWLIGDLAKPRFWKHVLVKDSVTNKVSVRKGARGRGQVPEKSSGGKEAVLRVRPIERILWKAKVLTLAEFELETGRSHQIRVQAAEEGFPVAGDLKYGFPLATRSFLRAVNRPLLHSHRICFPHPKTSEILKFTAPLPDDMMKLKIRH